MFRDMDAEEHILLDFLSECTCRSDVRYFKCRQIAKELNGKLSSGKIAFVFTNWSKFENRDFNITPYAQRQDSTTWRIERCH